MENILITYTYENNLIKFNINNSGESFRNFHRVIYTWLKILIIYGKYSKFFLTPNN